MTSTSVNERVVPFTTADGHELHLINVRGSGDRGPVLLSHGAGVRAELFRPRTQRNFVDVLVDAGYDVWLENWRGSIDASIKQTNWTLDEAAVYDHPAAVQKIVDETSADSIKAVVHCQGSTSFCMSAAAGLVPQVDTIISSASSLLVNVPWWSGMKLKFAIPIMNRLTDSVDPGQADRPKGKVQKAITPLVKLTHRECSDTACRMVSFTYGAGKPALWRHENLSAEVHHPFIQKEFGRVPVSFFMQIRECVANGQLVSVSGFDELPKRFGDQRPETDARFVLMTGAKNQCFDPRGQRRTYDWLREFDRGRHALHIFDGYSHLDVFFGERAEHDIFPTLLRELEGGD